MHFGLVQKSSTLDDPERPICTLLQKRSVFWSQLQKFVWRYTHYGWHISRPMTIVSGNIKCMRTIVAIPLGGGLKWQWGCRRRQLLAI